MLCIPVVIIICYTSRVIVKVVAIIHPQLNVWWVSQLVISVLLFVILYWLISRSQRFNNWELTVQKRWLRLHNGWGWQLIANLFDPKLLVLWDFLLAAWLMFQGQLARSLFVLITLGTVLKEHDQEPLRKLDQVIVFRVVILWESPSWR